jgi:hypothetical protein
LDVSTRGELGHDAAKALMDGMLGGDDIGEH